MISPTSTNKLVFSFDCRLQRTIHWSILGINLIWWHWIILLLALRFLRGSISCLFGHHIINYRVFKLLLGETAFYTFVSCRDYICSWGCILSDRKGCSHIWSWFLLEVIVWRLIKVASWIIVVLTVILWIVKRLVLTSCSTYCII